MISKELLDRLEPLAAEPVKELCNIAGMAESATDPELMALCAGYVDAALRCQDWLPPEGGLSEREQAFIRFTEQFVSSVSSMGAQDVARLLDFESADGVYAFVHALYVKEMSLRLEIVGREVLL